VHTDYIREAENVLWYYNNIYNSLANLDKQIARLKWEGVPRELCATDYGKDRVSGGGRDSTENILFKVSVLMDCRRESLLKLDEIDEQLQQISVERGCEQYGKVLRLWYVEKMAKEDIAPLVGYAHREQVYKLRNRAIRKFAANLFGIAAVQGM
jgi:hypothetical protein